MSEKKLDIWLKRRLENVDGGFYDVFNRVDPLIGDYQQFLEEISFEVAFWTFDLDDNDNEIINGIKDYIDYKFGQKIYKKWKNAWELDAKLNKK